MQISDIFEWIHRNGDWLTIFAITTIFTIITIRYYIKKDKFEREPTKRLIWAVILGMISVIPSILLSLLMGLFVAQSLSSIIIAPVAEEIGKGIFVLWLARSEEFDGPMDGLIYGALVGAGFAYVENFLYALQALGQYGLGSGIVVASIRSVFQIIGHPLYTGITGIGVGAYSVGMGKYRLLRIIPAMLLHALWNGISILTSSVLLGYFGVILLAIFILRLEIKRAVKIDKEAFDRGYYADKDIPYRSE